MSKLSEVDKLIQKIDFIYKELGGEQDPNYFDISNIKDKYEKLRAEVSRSITEIETLLNDKDSLKEDNINEKYKLEAKIADKLEVLSKQMKELEIELKAQSKKSTKEDFSSKQRLVDSFNKRYLILRNRSEGIEVNVTEDNINKNQIDQLQNEIKSKGPQRELYQEEIDKMEEWDRKVADQDKALMQIHVGVKELKVDARQIGRQIDDVSKAIDKTNKKAEETGKKLETTNKKLKDLLEKLRGSDKICVDIVLICICLGLVAVLYNLIKKYI